MQWFPFKFHAGHFNWPFQLSDYSSWYLYASPHFLLTFPKASSLSYWETQIKSALWERVLSSCITEVLRSNDGMRNNLSIYLSIYMHLTERELTKMVISCCEIKTNSVYRYSDTWPFQWQENKYPGRDLHRKLPSTISVSSACHWDSFDFYKPGIWTGDRGRQGTLRVPMFVSPTLTSHSGILLPRIPAPPPLG